jgi:hypothetical protein
MRKTAPPSDDSLFPAPKHASPPRQPQEPQRQSSCWSDDGWL